MLLTTRPWKARLDRIARRNEGTGAVGTSNVSLEARASDLRVATSAPPALTSKASVKSINDLPPLSTPRRKRGIAKGIR